MTRPASQAEGWVRRLQTRGIEAAALPLIEIAPPVDPRPVAAAWRGLGRCRLAVFVSPNAVEQFFAQRPEGSEAWPASTDAASVGPGTTRALQQGGVPAERIVEPAADSPRFDSETLWQQRLAAREWRGADVLVVRGDGGREWLADTLRAHGAAVRFVAAYRRIAPRFDRAQAALLEAALAAPAQHLWLFSSSESIDHLVAAASGARFAEARAIATHPRIAERARRAGFGVVAEARPTLDAVVACIQSFAS